MCSTSNYKTVQKVTHCKTCLTDYILIKAGAVSFPNTRVFNVNHDWIKQAFTFHKFYLLKEE